MSHWPELRLHTWHRLSIAVTHSSGIAPTSLDLSRPSRRGGRYRRVEVENASKNHRLPVAYWLPIGFFPPLPSARFRDRLGNQDARRAARRADASGNG